VTEHEPEAEAEQPGTTLRYELRITGDAEVIPGPERRAREAAEAAEDQEGGA
jgi:hypothetical protein